MLTLNHIHAAHLRASHAVQAFLDHNRDNLSENAVWFLEKMADPQQNRATHWNLHSVAGIPLYMQDKSKHRYEGSDALDLSPKTLDAMRIGLSAGMDWVKSEARWKGLGLSRGDLLLVDKALHFGFSVWLVTLRSQAPELQPYFKQSGLLAYSRD